MKPMRLEDMIPEETQVTLVSPGGEKKSYDLRCINLEDEAWMIRVFGPTGIQSVFKENIDVVGLAKIIFRQLKDKSDFLPRSEETYDEDGEKVTLKVTGPDLVLRGIVGKAHVLEVLQALSKIIGASQPPVEEEDKKAMDEKKKELEERKAETL